MIKYNIKPYTRSISGFLLALCLCWLPQAYGNRSKKAAPGTVNHLASDSLQQLAEDVKAETLRTWKAYEKYAWGHDNLLPLSKAPKDWYEKPLYISLIDAYSTLKLMGFETESRRIEEFVIENVSFEKDMFIKTFEVNIRVLGGLLSMYGLSGDQRILDKAEDFGKRMLKAFDSPTGLPYYYFNPKTGAVKGNIINLAEAGSYVFELGILSYYTKNPMYYKVGKKASLAIHQLRSGIGLFGRDIDVETGEWIVENSMVGAYADSHFEYLYKGYTLFGDPDLLGMWNECLEPIQQYIAEPEGDKLWYGKVNMHTGEKVNSIITLWDAYFPALLALSGNLDQAEPAMNAWNAVWNRENLVPRVYDYAKDSILDPYYQLNPEVIESAYYLKHFTGKEVYSEMLKDYYADMKAHCRTEVAYCSLENVVTKKQADELPTFFFAETMKYFFLAFDQNTEVNLTDYVFSTEAHPFRKSDFKWQEMAARLGISK